MSCNWVITQAQTITFSKSKQSQQHKKLQQQCHDSRELLNTFQVTLGQFAHMDHLIGIIRLLGWISLGDFGSSFIYLAREAVEDNLRKSPKRQTDWPKGLFHQNKSVKNELWHAGMGYVNLTLRFVLRTHIEHSSLQQGYEILAQQFNDHPKFQTHLESTFPAPNITIYR